MTDDELVISRSTPGARFDAPASAAASPTTAAAAPAELSADAEAFVAQVIADAEQPVVLFALEWCEFCWSLRKLFAACGIAYRSVDLDSTEYQAGDRGGRIRTVLAARTGSRTIPQLFVGGDWIGGTTETMAAFKDGRLQRLLRAHDVAFDEQADVDPDALLPAWLHPR
ncbi:MAG: glutaredoxin domain-containing protein [Luteimonas sp.]